MDALEETLDMFLPGRKSLGNLAHRYNTTINDAIKMRTVLRYTINKYRFGRRRLFQGKGLPAAYLQWRESTVTQSDNAVTGAPLRACPLNAPLAMHRIYPTYCIRKNIGVVMLADNVPHFTGQP